MKTWRSHQTPSASLTQTHFITSENGLAAPNLKGRFGSFKVGGVPWKGYDQLLSYLLQMARGAKPVSKTKLPC